MIPEFDHNHVIPPHLGNPTEGTELSPYECSSLELCKHFATSKDRINILQGLMNFRIKIFEFGIINGFQWLDGSFLEDIELLEKRSPRDLDLVTFYYGLSEFEINNILENFSDFFDPEVSKTNYNLDHYVVDCMYDEKNNYLPTDIIDYTRYWTLLFSHNRRKIWKGMLRLSLNTISDDKDSLIYLKNLIL